MEINNAPVCTKVLATPARQLAQHRALGIEAS
jgi:hypothetical protein